LAKSHRQERNWHHVLYPLAGPIKTIKISAQAKLADKASNKNHKSSSVVDAPRKKEKSTKASVAVICELRHLAVF
jgi:hypothetical protein